MGNCLLSIDWDYFISTGNSTIGSYIENKRTIIDLWYKRYLQSLKIGVNIMKSFELSSDIDNFWDRIKKTFIFDKNLKFYVSDSHSLSYNIAKQCECNTVYLFDAHSDLGYGGISSLDFEINCANWLGKLFKDQVIEKAYVIYSPYTFEKPDYFKPMNDIYNIEYPKFEELNRYINVSAIHICRSGAWTPPWYDNKFIEFINKSGITYSIIDCPMRTWDTENITLSDEIYYMMI